jgi:hypothetical protein
MSGKRHVPLVNSSSTSAVAVIEGRCTAVRSVATKAAGRPKHAPTPAIRRARKDDSIIETISERTALGVDG